MYDTVLVATDGSDASTAAVEQGVAMADRFGGSVHFLHVVDVGTEMSAAGGNVAEELSESLEQVADDALSEATAHAESVGVPVERTVLEGVPHEAVEAYVDDHDVDVAVLGATGRSGLKEHLVGSTTERVVQSLDVSVLVARAD